MTKAMTCTACPEHERICEQVFRCRTCDRVLNVCRHGVGDSGECTQCWELRELGPEWVRFWADKLSKQVGKGEIEKVVQLAVRHQLETTSSS